MIDFEKYKLILSEGLMLDHYLLLLNMRDKNPLVPSKRIQGFTNLMYKKGYLNEDGEVTEKAKRILEGQSFPVPEVPKTITTILKPESQRFDYATWVIQLHKKCEEKIMVATGKRQIRPAIGGKGYPFLPNSTDLGKVILRAVNTYQLKDFDRIELTILRYIDRCIRANSWFPILGYYVMKGGNSTATMFSQMVTEMSSDEEETQGDNPSIHIV